MINLLVIEQWKMTGFLLFSMIEYGKIKRWIISILSAILQILTVQDHTAYLYLEIELFQISASNYFIIIFVKPQQFFPTKYNNTLGLEIVSLSEELEKKPENIVTQSTKLI